MFFDFVQVDRLFDAFDLINIPNEAENIRIILGNHLFVTFEMSEIDRIES